MQHATDAPNRQHSKRTALPEVSCHPFPLIRCGVQLPHISTFAFLFSSSHPTTSISDWMLSIMCMLGISLHFFFSLSPSAKAFRDIATVVWNYPFEHYGEQTQPRNIPMSTKPVVIYSQTSPQSGPEIAAFRRQPFVLISGSSDYPASMMKAGEALSPLATPICFVLSASPGES